MGQGVSYLVGIKALEGVQSHLVHGLQYQHIAEYANGLQAGYPQAVAHFGHSFFYFGLRLFPNKLAI